MPRSVIIYTENKCAYCNNMFKYDADHKNRKYCNYLCSRLGRRSRINIICKECGISFETQTWNKNAKYCSDTCWHESMKSNIVNCECTNCKKSFFRRSHLLNRSKNIFCTKKCADIYNRGSNHYEWKDSLNKECVVCKNIFKSGIKDKNNRQNKCCSIECKKIYQSKYTLAGILKINESGNIFCKKCNEYKQVNDFYIKHRNVCKSCATKSTDTYRNELGKTIEGTLRIRLKSSKCSCKKRKIYFDGSLNIKFLMDMYYHQSGLCNLSGRILTHSSTKDLYDMDTISIDRIDSKKGYTKDNIHLVCWGVNQMKNDMTIEELLSWCKDILSKKWIINIFKLN